MQSDRRKDLAAGLVEYFVISVPTLDSLAVLSPALHELVGRAAIRVLDLVIVAKAADGTLSIREYDSVEGGSDLRDVVTAGGPLLSDGDIRMAALALHPGSLGVIIVSEDRWAEPLSLAVEQAGGQIVAGDRIPAPRIESVLADSPVDQERGDD